MVHGAASTPVVLWATALEDFFEEVPELCVEDSVYDGVQGAVDIAQPRHHAH